MASGTLELIGTTPSLYLPIFIVFITAGMKGMIRLTVDIFGVERATFVPSQRWLFPLIEYAILLGMFIGLVAYGLLGAIIEY